MKLNTNHLSSRALPLLGALFFLGPGCASSPPAAGGHPFVRKSCDEPTPSPAERMKILSQVLASAGAEEIVWSTTSHIDEEIAVDAELPPMDGARVILVALGAPAELDLDLRLTDRDGAVLASDDSASRRVMLEARPPSGEALFVHVSSRAGSGAIAAAAFRLEDGHDPPSVSSVLARDPVPSTDDAEAKSIAVLRGFDKRAAEASVELLQGEGHGLPVGLHRGRCYLFGALGSAGIDALSLSLRTGGKTLASAPVAGRDAWISHCPDEPRDAVLGLLVRGGGGRVRLVVFEGARERVLPPRASTTPEKPAASPQGLAAALERKMRARGYEEGVTLGEGAFGPRSRHALVLPDVSGRCFVVSLVVTDRAPGSYLTVEPPGRPERLFADNERGVAQLPLCVDGDDEIQGVAISAGGEGPWTALLHQLPPIELPASDPPYSLREAAARLAAASLAPVRAITGSDSAVRLEGGRCHAVAAATTEPTILELVLEGDDEAVLGRSEGPTNVATVALCPEEDLLVRPSLRTRDDSAPPSVVLFSSPAPDPPSALPDDIIP